jgi:MFS family permease
MFRWLQGIGGCGIYAIATLLFFELVPPSKFANYTALVTAVVSVAMSAGPLIGGVINDHGIWRWAFLIKWVFATPKRPFSNS